MQPVEHIAQNVPECPPGAWFVRLTRGQFAIVDEADYPMLAMFDWMAAPRPTGVGFDAVIIGKQLRKEKVMHRIIARTEGRACDVDHIDGDTLNNRRSNLRICTRSQNNQNRRKRKTETSAFKGVHVVSGRIRASIGVNRDKIYLGTFASEIDAALAYDDAARLHFGEYACVNFPKDGEQGALSVVHDPNMQPEQPRVFISSV